MKYGHLVQKALVNLLVRLNPIQLLEIQDTKALECVGFHFSLRVDPEA